MDERGETSRGTGSTEWQDLYSKQSPLEVVVENHFVPSTETCATYCASFEELRVTQKFLLGVFCPFDLALIYCVNVMGKGFNRMTSGMSICNDPSVILANDVA